MAKRDQCVEVVGEVVLVVDELVVDELVVEEGEMVVVGVEGVVGFVGAAVVGGVCCEGAAGVVDGVLGSFPLLPLFP